MHLGPLVLFMTPELFCQFASFINMQTVIRRIAASTVLQFQVLLGYFLQYQYGIHCDNVMMALNATEQTSPAPAVTGAEPDQDSTGDQQEINRSTDSLSKYLLTSLSPESLKRRRPTSDLKTSVSSLTTCPVGYWQRLRGLILTSLHQLLKVSTRLFSRICVNPVAVLSLCFSQ